MRPCNDFSPCSGHARCGIEPYLTLAAVEMSALGHLDILSIRRPFPVHPNSSRHSARSSACRDVLMASMQAQTWSHQRANSRRSLSQRKNTDPLGNGYKFHQALDLHLLHEPVAMSLDGAFGTA